MPAIEAWSREESVDLFEVVFSWSRLEAWEAVVCILEQESLMPDRKTLAKRSAVNTWGGNPQPPAEEVPDYETKLSTHDGSDSEHLYDFESSFDPYGGDVSQGD